MSKIASDGHEEKVPCLEGNVLLMGAETQVSPVYIFLPMYSLSHFPVSCSVHGMGSEGPATSHL